MKPNSEGSSVGVSIVRTRAALGPAISTPYARNGRLPIITLEPMVEHALPRLAQGGTAVGTGLNAPDGFGAKVVDVLVAQTGLAELRTATNSFEAQAARDGLVEIETTEIPDDWADRWRDFHEPVLPTPAPSRRSALPSWATWWATALTRPRWSTASSS